MLGVFGNNMSYGEVYIEDDISKMKKAGYKKKYIIGTMAKRIRYRYNDITKVGANRIALSVYDGSNTTIGWKSRRKGKPPVITSRDRILWKKLKLNDI